MKTPLSWLLTLAAGGAFLCVGAAAQADDHNIDLSQQYTYGNVDQGDNRIQPQGACGPTATVNSFVYLQNRYGVNLIPHVDGNDQTQDRIAVVNNLSTRMGNVGAGVTDQHFLEGKIGYIGDHNLLGTIKVEARGNSITPPAAPFPYAGSPYVDVVNTTPAWLFLWNQLQAGQDVEVGFTWLNNGGPSSEESSGHWVTADSFHFNDLNNNGIIDNNETAQMDFVDPWGAQQITGTLIMGGFDGQHMVLTYQGGAAGVGASGMIDAIVAESVPEPTSLALLGMGVLALCRRTRKA